MGQCGFPGAKIAPRSSTGLRYRLMATFRSQLWYVMSFSGLGRTLRCGRGRHNNRKARIGKRCNDTLCYVLGFLWINSPVGIVLETIANRGGHYRINLMLIHHVMGLRPRSNRSIPPLMFRPAASKAGGTLTYGGRQNPEDGPERECPRCHNGFGFPLRLRPTRRRTNAQGC